MPCGSHGHSHRQQRGLDSELRVDETTNQGDHRSPAGEEKEDVPAPKESCCDEGTDQGGPEASTPTSEGVYTGVHRMGGDC